MMAKGTTASLLANLVADGCTLRLFVNDVTPTANSELSDFIEPGSGYQSQAMFRGDWSIIEGVPCEARGAPVVFAFTAPAGVIRGLFLTRGKSLLWAERFKEAQNLINQADTLEVAPTLTAS